MNLIEVSGVILAGGRSSRMKFNKAFAEISGKQVINILIDKFTGVFAETIIISNEPELFNHLGLPVFTDIYPRMGPVSGIHSGLCHANYDKVFILGCDIPFINMNLVKYMADNLGDYDSVVAEIDTYLQPLAAIYSRRCISVLNAYLQQDRVKLVRIFEKLNALIMTRDELEKFGNIEEMFLNLNDIETLKLANRMAGGY